MVNKIAEQRRKVKASVDKGEMNRERWIRVNEWNVCVSGQLLNYQKPEFDKLFLFFTVHITSCPLDLNFYIDLITLWKLNCRYFHHSLSHAYLKSYSNAVSRWQRWWHTETIVCCFVGYSEILPRVRHWTSVGVVNTPTHLVSRLICQIIDGIVPCRH